MPMPIRSSERNRPRAWALARDIWGQSLRLILTESRSLFQMPKDSSCPGPRAGRGLLALPAAIVANQRHHAAQYCQSNQDGQRGLVVFCEEAHDVAAVSRS